MYAIEFETDVKNKYIKIPDYEKFAFQHVKVVVMAEPEEVSKKENTDDEFWMNASNSSIDDIWGNDKDNIYEELLNL